MCKSRDSSVGIATAYGLDGRGSIPDGGKRFVFFSTAFTPALVPTQPPIKLIPGTPSPAIKRPGHDADHSPASNAEVKNGGAIPPLPHTSSWRDA
jgi:hypothetical protein